MKLLPLCVALLTIVMLGSAQADEVPLDKLISEVKLAIFKVQQDAVASGLPKLQSVELQLVTEQKLTAGGGFSIFILDFSKKYTRDSATTISLTLTPPDATGKSQVGQDQIADVLKNAILATMKAVDKAKQSPGPALNVSNLKASIKFGVEQDTSGGIKFTISPVTLNGSGDGNTSATQQITVTYGTSK